MAAKFKENCLIQDNISFTPRNVVHLLIVYELDTQISHQVIVHFELRC